jgi:hypothetical protein
MVVCSIFFLGPSPRYSILNTIKRECILHYNIDYNDTQSNIESIFLRALCKRRPACADDIMSSSSFIIVILHHKTSTVCLNISRLASKKGRIRIIKSERHYFFSFRSISIPYRTCCCCKFAVYYSFFCIFLKSSQSHGCCCDCCKSETQNQILHEG